MIISNITINQMNEALERVNAKYDNNITWNRTPEPVGKKLRFTIKVKDSKGKGAKVSYGFGYKSRRTRSCCWHIHGDLFDILLDIAPKAIIKTNGNDLTIYENDNGDIIGNWRDWNIGSIAYPMYFSESYECE